MNLVPQNTLYMIDGSSFLYRAYYGLRPLHAPDGRPVQAVYSFCRMIKKLIESHGMQYVVIVWDSKGKTHRHELFADYKATRQAPPSDIFDQKELIIEFANLVGIAQASKGGLEADDIMFSFAVDAQKQGMTAVLCTSDKDMMQALDESIIMYDPLKNEWVDQAAAQEKFGFPSSKLPFFYALVGDASDNIPGVAGIGKKGAADLVNAYENLDDLYAHLDDLKPRTKTLLETQKEHAYLSFQLFLLHYEPILSDKNVYYFAHEQFARAEPLFKRLAFKNFLPNRLTASAKSEVKATAVADIESKIAWWSQQNIVMIDSMASLHILLQKIKSIGFCAIDTETDGAHALQCQLIGISFCYASDGAFYVPVAHDTMPNGMKSAEIIAACKPLLEDASIAKYMHNAKFDMQVFYAQGIMIAGLTFDTMVAARLVLPEWNRVGLKFLSDQLLEQSMLSFDEVVKSQGHKTFNQVPLDIATLYGGADALQTFKLVEIIEKKLHEDGLAELYQTIEHPLISVLNQMEIEGIGLDVPFLNNLGIVVGDRMQEIETQIASFVPDNTTPINLNSPRQIEKLLFVDLLLPTQKKSATGNSFSTDVEVLTTLAKMHPVAGLILSYRELAKLKNTYIDALPSAVLAKTGKVHTNFSQTNVATGRLASSDPNLQNIPASGLGLEVRAAFKADPGYLFVAADYSQIELRVLAYLAQEPGLIEAFVQGKDIHAQTAAALFEVPISEVTHEQRQLGKRINFSVLYGQTPFGLSKELHISFADAKLYIDRYFAHYPAIQTWMEGVVQQAQADGFVTTIAGRRRFVANIHESNKNLFQEARRVAINTVAQGTAADIVKMGMIELQNQIKAAKVDAHMILQIHDELLISVKQEQQIALESLVKRVLESIAPEWNVPLAVTVRAGHNWKEVSK